MELNLDYLYNQANALKNKFDDKETELIKVKDKKVTELKDDDKETDVATKSIVDIGDAETATKVHQKDEGIITTKDKEKEKDAEESLEDKLKNIEKVIDTFSGKGTTVIDSGQSLATSSPVNLNQAPLDLGTTQAKAYQAEYLKPSTVHDDRIALLYENLKKYNLI